MPSKVRKKDHFWTTSAIQQELRNHLKAVDVPTLAQLSATIKRLRWERVKNNGIRGYYLVLKGASTSKK